MIRSAWHDQQMQEARRKVMDAVKYNLGHGYRLQHPGFQGLPDNSLGSKNRPFFGAKDEADVPLEHKIHARGSGNAGALWNPAGRKYAEQILQRRAIDTSALEEGMEAPQVVPPAGEEPTMEKKLQFNLMLQQLSQAVVQGSVSDLTADLFRRVISTAIGMIPFLDEDEIMRLYRVFTNMLETVQEDMGDGESTASRQIVAFHNSFNDVATSFLNILEEYLIAVEGKFLGVRERRAVRATRAKTGRTGPVSQTYTTDEKFTILKGLVKKYMKSGFFKGIEEAFKERRESSPEQKFIAENPDVNNEVLDDLLGYKEALTVGADEPVDIDTLASIVESVAARLGESVDTQDKSVPELNAALKKVFNDATGYKLVIQRVRGPGADGRSRLAFSIKE